MATSRSCSAGNKPVTEANRRNGATAAYGALTIVMLLWAGNSIVGRAVRDLVPPFTLAFVRWSGAFLVLLPFALRPMIAERALILRHMRIILLLAVLGVGAFNGFLYAGLHYTSAANGLLLQAAIPGLVLLFDRMFFGLRASVRQVAGVLLSTIGVILIVLRGDIGALLGFHFGKGDLLILCGVLVWALYTSLLRMRPAIHPLGFVASTFIVGIICMAPLAAIEWASGGFPSLTRGTFGAFAYVAIFPSVIAYILFNAAVARIGAAKAGQTIALMPLFGAVLASALLDEKLHGYHLAGMALILIGIAISALAGPKEG